MDIGQDGDADRAECLWTRRRAHHCEESSMEAAVALAIKESKAQEPQVGPDATTITAAEAVVAAAEAKANAAELVADAAKVASAEAEPKSPRPRPDSPLPRPESLMPRPRSPRPMGKSCTVGGAARWEEIRRRRCD